MHMKARAKVMTKEDRIEIEEDFIVDVEVAIHRLMKEKSINKSQLAEALGISKSAVSQTLADGGRNLSIRKVARILGALGERAELTSATLRMLDNRNATRAKERRSRARSVYESSIWNNKCDAIANDPIPVIESLGAWIPNVNVHERFIRKRA